MDERTEKDLGTADFRVTQVTGLALVGGSLIYAAIAVILPYIGRAAQVEGESPQDMVQVLSWTHAALFVAALVAVRLLPTRAGEDAAPSQAVTHHVLRWAVLEAPALFGITVVLIAGKGGLVPEQPLYYANLLSFVVFAVMVFADLGRLGEARRRER